MLIGFCPINHPKQAFCFWLTIILLFGSQAANALNLTGNWQYQSTDQKTGVLDHRYAIDEAKTVHLTQNMLVGGSIHATKSINESSTVDTLSPTLTYQLHNEAFNYNLTGTTNRRWNSVTSNGSSGNVSSSVQMNWQSNWLNNGLIPSAQFIFGQDWSEDDLTIHNQDSDNKNTGVNLKWDFSLVNIFSTYNYSKYNDGVNGNSSQTDSYSAGLDVAQMFWQDKLNVSFSQRYSQSDRKNTLKTLDNNTVLFPLTMSQTYYAEIDPDLDLALTVEVDSANNLMNGDKTDAAVTVNSPTAPLKMNIGFKVDFQTVDVIYLYTSTLLGSEMSEFGNWAIYSSADNNHWSLSEVLTNVVYDTISRRFQLAISPLSVDYIKIVPLITPLSTAVTFSELEIFDEIAAQGDFVDIKTTDEQYQTNCNLGLQISPDLRLSSSLSYQQIGHSSGQNVTRENFGGSLGWNPNAYFLSSLSTSITNTKQSQAANTSNRSYGLQISVPPLPTVNTSVGVNFSESYEDSIKQATNTIYNLSVSADLYKDLHTNWDNNYSNNKSIETGDESKQFNSSLAITARLNPKILADIHGTYNDGTGQAASQTLNANLNWRPSALLSASFSTNNSWKEEYSATIATSLGIVPSSKTQIVFGNSFTITPESSSSYYLNLQWNINNFLDFSTHGSYNTNEDSDSWSIITHLNAAYTIF